MIKRGILLVIFLVSIILVNAATSLQLGLTKSSYSPGESISGYFNYSFDDSKNADTPVKIYINNILIGEETLEELLGDIGGEVTDTSYTDAGDDPVDVETLTFNEAGSQAKIGINFTYTSLNSLDIKYILFNITGELNNNDYPMVPSLDFGDDKINEWQYIGELTNNYNNLKKDYLTRSSGNVNSGNGMGITAAKVICEKVDLKPSSVLAPSTGYDIRVRVKRGAAWSSKGDNKLWAFIYGTTADSAPTISPCTGTTIPNCCLIDDSQITNSFKEEGVGCAAKISNFVVNENKNYFMCVYQTGTTSYYTIDVEEYPNIVRGWYNGGSTEGVNNYDYFIWGKYQVYETNLSRLVNITQENPLSTSIATQMEDYVKHSKNCEENQKSCIVPIRARSEGPGKLKLENLKAVYNSFGENTIDKFVNINEIPTTITYDGIAKIYLSDFEGLIAPAEDGDYKIKIMIGSDSSEKDFSVVPVPMAVIYYEPWTVTTGIPVYFTADDSISPTGANFTKIQWNFGDGTNGTGSNATHIYKKIGDMEIKLTITDETGFIGEAATTISVQSLEKSLSDNLNLSEEFINVVKSKVASSEDYVKDTVNLLGFGPIWNNALNQIVLLKGRYQSVLNFTAEKKEPELITIYNSLMTIMNSVPQSIDVQSIEFPAGVSSISEIPSATELGLTGAKEDFGQAVLAYQEGINVKGDARAVSVVYLSGKDSNFILVKKTISSSKALTGRIYEIAPSGAVKNLTTPNYQAVVPNSIYSWPSETREIVYSLEGSDAKAGISTRTIVIPTLSDLKFGEGAVDILNEGFDCGNDVCNSAEDEVSCPEDCSRNYPWFFIITLFLIGIIGVYYFNFYKGPWNYKELGGNLNALLKGKPKLFKSKDEENKLINFVKVSKGRGLNDDQTKFMLKSKGWNDSQINEAIKKSSLSQRKVIKIGK